MNCTVHFELNSTNYNTF